MRNFKKVLSLVLCLAMMLSIMVVGAGAAFDDQDKIENAEAVEMCTALGIIDGFEDGNYHPEKNITRAQAAKLISVMVNGGKDAVKDVATSSYTDVLTDSSSAWANKYVEFCSVEGIVAGVGGGRFAPAANLTGTQLAKMLLVALGYDADKEGFVGSAWALKVNTAATKAGLYKGLEDVDVSAALSRDNAAQMIWNALNASTVTYLTSTTGALANGGTLLANAFNAKIVSGINKGTSKYNFDTKEYTYKIGSERLTSTKNFADLYAMSVKALVQGGDIIAMTAAKGGVVFEGSLYDLLQEAVPDIEDAFNELFISGDMTIDRLADILLESNLNLDNNASGDVTARIGGFNQYGQVLADIPVPEKAPVRAILHYGVRAIDQDGGGDIDYLVIYPSSVLKVTDVDTNKVSVRDLKPDDGKCVAVNSDPCEMAGTYATKATAIQGIIDTAIGGVKHYAQVKGDLERYGYAIGIPADNTLEHLNTLIDLDAKTGKIASMDTGDCRVTFAGDATYTAYPMLGEDFHFLKSLSVKYEYDYVALNGHLFLVNGAGVMAQANYAVVNGIADCTTGTTANVYEAELLLPDGTTKTVEVSGDSWEAVWPGDMVTYEIDNKGVYHLRLVESASLNADNCIFDIQDVNYDLDQDMTLPYGEDKVGVFVGGTEGKYYVTDDTIVYAYYSHQNKDVNDSSDDDNYYAVISADQLKNNIDDVLDVYVAAANKASNGFYEAQIVYVEFEHDVNEVVQTIYIDGRTARVAQDANDDYYVVVDAMLPGGEMKEIESKHVDRIETAYLLLKLYTETYVDNVYEVRMLDGKIVHVAEEVDLTAVEVTATYDGKGAFTADGVTYVVTDDTKVFSLKGKDLSAITKDDTVRIVAGEIDEHGTAELDVLVYAD